MTRKYADILALSRPDSAETAAVTPDELGEPGKDLSPLPLCGDTMKNWMQKNSAASGSRSVFERRRKGAALPKAAPFDKTQVRVRYFAADSTARPSACGFYHTITGTVQRIDPVYRLLHLEDRSIPFETLDPDPAAVSLHLQHRFPDLLNDRNPQFQVLPCILQRSLTRIEHLCPSFLPADWP